VTAEYRAGRFRPAGLSWRTGLVALALAMGGPAHADDRPARGLDLNVASRAELMKLPGIGEAEARRIVQGRPYKSKADLVTKNVLEPAAYDRLQRLVMVDHRRAGAKPKPTAAASKQAS
jgi:hypothetical protein